jgi:hypothetical protein
LALILFIISSRYLARTPSVRVSPHLASEEISDASSGASCGISIAILFLRTGAIPHSRFPRMYSSISPPLCR